VESFDDRIRRKFELVQYDRSDMRDYQVEDVETFKRMPYGFAYIGMGLGKTVTFGTLIYDLICDGMDDKVLILGPIPVIASSWPDEFRSWRHLAALNFTVLREDDADPRLKAARKAARLRGEKESGAETAMRVSIRHELARSRAQIHLANFEAIEWLVEFWDRKWPYRLVIIDEASLFKSHKSTRFDLLKRIRLGQGYIKRLYLLTGTPFSEGLESLFSLTFLLDCGQRFGKHVTKFQNEYFISNRYSFKLEPRSDAAVRLLNAISDISVVRKREDHFDTKDPQIIRRKVLLRQSEMELYQALQDDYLVKLPDGNEIEAETAAALSQKLCQLASGVLYETVLEEPEGYDPDDDDRPDLVRVRRVHHIHDHKIEMLRQIVDELNGKPILVSYQHRSSLDRLVKAFPKAVKWDKSGKTKEPWNKGKIKMMLMHPKSGGHGNNLQAGGHHIVFFDIPWSRDQFAQLIGRLDRQGQRNEVVVFLLIAAMTIDETIAKAQEQKRDAEEAAYRLLKSMIAKRRRKSRITCEEDSTTGR
jgi:SNF2 family DNA or RNA helicase